MFTFKKISNIEYQNRCDELNKQIKLLESFYSGISENKQDVKYDGYVVGFKSDELNKEFIKNIYKNPYFTTQAAKNLEKSINSKKIIPVYTSKSWIGDIIDTFTWIFRSMSGIIVGFYDGKRIVIMISALRNLDGSILKAELYNIISHEHQHKFAGERSSYHADSKVKKILDTWYNHFMDHFFKGNLSDYGRKMLLKFWTNIKGEYTTKNTSNYILKRNQLFNEVISHLKEKEDSIIKNRLTLLNSYVKNLYFGGVNIDYEPYISGEYAYKEMGIRSHTYIYQEFVIASEVTAVTAGNNREFGNYTLSKYLR